MDALLEVGTSFNSLVALYEGNSDYRQEVPFFKELLYKDEQTYGPDHPDVAWRLNNLADLYRALGRYADAQPLFERALNLLSKTRGPKHPSVAFVLNNLAGMQILKRNYGDAEVMATHINRKHRVRLKCLRRVVEELLFALAVEHRIFCLSPFSSEI